MHSTKILFCSPHTTALEVQRGGLLLCELCKQQREGHLNFRLTPRLAGKMRSHRCDERFWHLSLSRSLCKKYIFSTYDIVLCFEKITQYLIFSTPFFNCLRRGPGRRCPRRCSASSARSWSQMPRHCWKRPGGTEPQNQRFFRNDLTYP